MFREDVFTMPCVLLSILVCCVFADFVEPPESYTLTSVAERETRLPCRYEVPQGSSVVQVNWNKEQPDGTPELIITAHHTEGTVVGHLATRVRFASKDPLRDSSLLILDTETSDEGRYTCQVITYPSGTVSTTLSLIVWTVPISLIEPVIMEEGQTFRVAALCRSTARPPPILAWDTDLPGQSLNKSGEGGRVSLQFSLQPLRNMNGRKLDCLVSHPTLERPHRIRNTLVVHYPPSAVVGGYDGNWFAGREGAELTCEFGGNPKVENITWSRRGAELPDGVTVESERLVFGRPLVATDEGVYECEARNRMGSDRAELQVTVRELQRHEAQVDTFPTIIVGGVAGGLVVVMVIIIIIVTTHHRRKNRKLKKELSERTEEINSLSRQTSLRRLNSASTDLRSQMDDVFIRVDSVTKNSMMSLEECSTLQQPPGGVCDADLDSLGRPPIYTSYQSPRDSNSWRARQEEESKRRVETYLKSSDHSLDSGLHSSLVPPLSSEAPLLLDTSATQSPSSSQGTDAAAEVVKPPPPWAARDGGGGVVDAGQLARWARRGAAAAGGDRKGEATMATAAGEGEGEAELDEDEDQSNSRISEALSNHFHYSNGYLRPKFHPNAIILHPRGQII
ncbi:nectin-4 [Engraulis encrasicolus]|uniref:nectin-4 n=1 Tax=Engraulis encrasicolus TaxID=184585 RepID=UPI002FD3397E